MNLKQLAAALDANMPGGFATHSYAGDDFRLCRDHVLAALGLPAFKPCEPF